MLRVSVAIVVVCLILTDPPLPAAPVLDQRQDLADDWGASSESYLLGQTFTAGLSGVLDHVEVGNTTFTYEPPGFWPAVLEFRNAEAGHPGATVLGAVLLPGGVNAGWNSFDFRAQGIPLTAGEMYSILLRADKADQTVYVGIEFDAASYADGGIWTYDAGAGTWDLGARFGEGDMQFRTYVDTSAVIPAPGTLLLAGIGTGLIGWLRRRRTL